MCTTLVWCSKAFRQVHCYSMAITQGAASQCNTTFMLYGAWDELENNVHRLSRPWCPAIATITVTLCNIGELGTSVTLLLYITSMYYVYVSFFMCLHRAYNYIYIYDN